MVTQTNGMTEDKKVTEGNTTTDRVHRCAVDLAEPVAIDRTISGLIEDIAMLAQTYTSLIHDPLTHSLKANTGQN